MIELSLSETARRHGMAPSTLSKAIKEGRAPKGHRLKQYAAFEGMGENRRVIAFHFPDDYPFPEWSEEEEGDSQGATKEAVESTVEMGVESGGDSTRFNDSTPFNERSVESPPASGGDDDRRKPRERRGKTARDRHVRRGDSSGSVESSGEARILTDERVDKLIEKGGNVALANPEFATALMWPGMKAGGALLAGGYALTRAPAQQRDDTSAVDDAVTILGAAAAGGLVFAAVDWAVDGRDSLIGQLLGGLGPEPARPKESTRDRSPQRQHSETEFVSQIIPGEGSASEEEDRSKGEVEQIWNDLVEAAPDIAGEVRKAIQEE